jgi:hypothetical protein
MVAPCERSPTEKHASAILSISCIPPIDVVIVLCVQTVSHGCPHVTVSEVLEEWVLVAVPVSGETPQIARWNAAYLWAPVRTFPHFAVCSISRTFLAPESFQILS